MTKENQEHKIPIPTWLQKIQDNSSELELLISGGAIYALSQASNFVDEFRFTISALSSDSAWHDMLGLSQFAISILIIGFVLHLIVRAYWLSLVCINYVYPKGVKHEDIKLAHPFKNNTKERPDLYEYILKADNICGLIMFLCICCSILWLGILFYSSLLDLLMSVMPAKVDDFLGWSFIIYIVDLLFSGHLRRIPYLSYIIYPIFTLLDWLTFRFIVNKGLLILKSNTRWHKRTFYITGFLILSVIYTGYTVSEKVMDPSSNPITGLVKKSKDSYTLLNSYKVLNNFYRDKKTYYKPKYSINSKVISNNFLELRISFNQKTGEYISENDTIKKIEDLYTIKINKNAIKNLHWYQWVETSSHRGLEAVISLTNLSEGKHILSIYDESIKKFDGDSITYGGNIEIPFWYDKRAASNQ